MKVYQKLKKKKFTTPLLLLFAFVAVLIPEMAEAKLGESYRGCEKIYGKAVGSTEVPGLIPNGLEFHRGEYSIICGFVDDRCTVVVVLRLSPTNPTEQSLVREDMNLFMEENFGQTNWTYTRLDQRGKFWKTYDFEKQRSYLASYAAPLRMLTMQIVEG